MKVIDVSRWNILKDAQAVKDSGVELVIMRVTIGNYYTDISFEEHWEKYGAVGLKLGVYHVTRPDIKVVDQFNYFKDAMKGRVPDLAVVQDCEVQAGQSPQVVNSTFHDMMVLLDDWYGGPSWFYTRTNWWNDRVVGGLLNLDVSWVNGHPLHIARYPWDPYPPDTLPVGSDPGELPVGFDKWDLWQWTSKGSCPGIQGNLDLDATRLSSSEFAMKFYEKAFPYLVTTTRVCNIHSRSTPKSLLKGMVPKGTTFYVTAAENSMHFVGGGWVEDKYLRR